jgi:outer membrane lipoprotein SlyB
MSALRVSRAVLSALAVSLALGGCARQIGGDVYEGRSLGGAVSTYRGVVESARYVTVQESDTLQGNTTGGLIGGVAGGAAGARFGQGYGKALAIGAGALLGATAGALAEQRLSNQDAIEYVVRTTDGQLFTVVQAPDDPMPAGTQVFVQLGGDGRARVMRAA